MMGFASLNPSYRSYEIFVTVTRVPAFTTPSAFTSPSAVAKTLHGLASRVSSP